MRVVTGEAKGKKLKSPKSVGTRPIMDRVKTALFDILADDVVDTTFLDLFAGTGGVGIEALSRGARHATFIELNPQIVRLVRDNLAITGFTERADVLRSDSFQFLQSFRPSDDEQVAAGKKSVRAPFPRRSYDIVYVAPPQYVAMAARALEMLDTTTLMAQDALLIIQIHPKERAEVLAVPCAHFALTDERRYGSTLLLFFRYQP